MDTSLDLLVGSLLIAVAIGILKNTLTPHRPAQGRNELMKQLLREN